MEKKKIAMNITDEQKENKTWADVAKAVQKHKNNIIMVMFKILAIIAIICCCSAFFNMIMDNPLNSAIFSGILFLTFYFYAIAIICKRYSLEEIIGRNGRGVVDIINKEYYTRRLLRKLDGEDFQIIVNG